MKIENSQCNEYRTHTAPAQAAKNAKDGKLSAARPIRDEVVVTGGSQPLDQPPHRAVQVV